MCRELVEELMEKKWPVEQSEADVVTGGDTEKNKFQGEVGSEVVVGLDAVGLYPSISKKLAMKVCREAAEKSDVKVRDMNLLEATRFLALTLTKAEIRKGGLTKVLPKRRKIPGKRTGTLGLTTENSFSATPNDMTQWVWPNRKLTQEEKRKIFSRVVEGFVKVFCETQTYTWRGKLFLQLTGLPIGPRGTSAIARVTMNSLDALFLELLEKLDLETKLRLRYIDDLRIAMCRILA